MPCSYLLLSLCREKWAFQGNTTVLVQKSFTALVEAGTSLKVGIMSEDWNEPKKGERSKEGKEQKLKKPLNGKAVNIKMDSCNPNPSK